MAKEFHIDVTRRQNRNGKFQTVVNVSRQERLSGRPQGLIHKAVNFKSNISGDIPSLSRKVNSFQPNSFIGQVSKATAGTALFMANKTINAAVKTSLATETAIIQTSKAVGRKALSEAEWRLKSTGDIGKGLVFAGKTTSIGASTALNLAKIPKKTVKNFKTFKAANNDFKLKKKEFVSFKKGNFKMQIKKNKSAFEIAKITKDKNKIKRLKIEKKQLKGNLKKKKINLALSKKQMKNARKLADPLRLTGGVALKELSSVSKKMKASAYQKLIHSDERNDAAKGINVVGKGAEFSGKIAKKGIKAGRLIKPTPQRRLERLNTTQNRLAKRKKKLGKKKSLLQKRKNNSAKKAAKKSKKTFKTILRKNKTVLALISFMSSGFMILFLVVFIVFFMFIGVFSNSGWVMGTYTADDYQLTQAEEYYTEIAKNWRYNIKNMSGKDWRGGAYWDNALSFFGYGSEYEDEIDEKGKVTKFNYVGDAKYDYDSDKLLSFLSAYFYNSKDNKIEYWKFNDDVKKAIDELFNDEYEFKYTCDGKQWRRLENFEYPEEYYAVDESTVTVQRSKWWYKFKPKGCPNELKDYMDGDGYLYIDNFYHVLNANDNFADTPYALYDNTKYANDKKKDREPLYKQKVNGGYYFRSYDGKYYDRTPVNYKIEGTNEYIDVHCFVSPKDSEKLFGKEHKNKMFYGYYKHQYYDENVTLNYGIYQKKTFDEAIKDKLMSKDSSGELYNSYTIFLGNNEDSVTTYGNHQMLKSILGEDTMRYYIDNSDYLANSYGYDVRGFNENYHCKIEDDLHEGIDIFYPKGSKIYSPGENFVIEDYDEDNKQVVLRIKHMNFFYANNGEGDDGDVKVRISNVELANGKKKDDALKEREYFAKVTDTRKCDGDDNDMGSDHIHIEVEASFHWWGGWEFIDPKIIFY